MDDEYFSISKKPKTYKDLVLNNRDTGYQLVISALLGVSAFLAFCILRPRWTGLYAARKKQKHEATALPELSDSLFGWIPTLWRISDEQVLASAGLDAYVFLAFFKMAVKFLFVALFFSLVVFKPVHDHFPDLYPPNSTINDTMMSSTRVDGRFDVIHALQFPQDYYETDFLWMYLVFAYVFSGLMIYLLVSETGKIIKVRQQYLGSQTTVTDRTIRLSGIPEDLREESKIKQFIEDLDIGKVESVTLCRNWKELDQAVEQRMSALRRLEEAWTVYLGTRRVSRNPETLPIVQPSPPGPAFRLDAENNIHEDDRLLDEQDHVTPYPRERPTTRVWYGPLKLRYRKVDAIDYYEEKLRSLDDKVKALRKKEFKPTPIAFVTLDSVAASQMAIQAVLNPSPLELIANSSPRPADVVWPNTYMTRKERLLRSWTITVIIAFLTVFWALLLVPIAGALTEDTIKKVWPALANYIDDHKFVKSLVNTQLPTLAVSLLSVLVPYLYEWLSNKQGMISQGDVELSLVSKNFFFVFFNFFIIFTLLGSAVNFVSFWEKFRDYLTDATKVANFLARSLSGLLNFYVNYIILQGVGLFPFRLLEFGSVALYPVGLIGAKTPRDYAELVQPPNFSYGFFLPQNILIFIICMVYSVLRSSWRVLLSGLVYFMLGHFVHKYQLLYAMDHRQHSTGRGWLIICDRVVVGLLLFQLTMAGQLALQRAFVRSLMIAPLIIATLWFSLAFSRSYRPLMKFIALRSIHKAEDTDPGREIQEEAVAEADEQGVPAMPARVRRQTIDEAREFGARFVNPSLVMPLENVWIADVASHLTTNGGSS
ncbi:hypothetical protein BDY21DRAFT_94558 [Lineolata rhizophorae]|uniref:DUF221-domain-containing protein n=1 Tax=Lineolata rhizophorae TaxID=578093 RepID=A0A6A6NTA0_9PEZI|nr:hypothetical protein BDY21DRAFT_94558 [Lineolata rhizophorae]